MRARVYDDRASAVALGLGALPHLLIAGSGILAPDDGQGLGRLQFLLGCVAVLVASVVLVALTPSGDAPFVAAVFVSTVGTLATFVAILTDVAPAETAAVVRPGRRRHRRLPARPLRPLRPAAHRLRARPRTRPTAATTPTSDPAPPEPRRRRARSPPRPAAATRCSLGLVGGCAAVVVGSAAVLGFSDSVWGQLLALATGLAMLLRARLFRYTSQVACALAAGLAALVLLGASASA